MFKRFGLSLLIAAAMVSGAAIKSAGSADAAAAGTAAADTTAAATGATAAGATTAAAAAPYTPKISEAELATAQRAKVYTQCQQPGQIALTFDDGPNPETTPIVLQYLKSKNLHATFFVNGINWSDLEKQPEAAEVLKQIKQEGFDIGSHTYYHKDLFEAIDEGTMEQNVDKMTDKIVEITGVKPAFFRPPCGNGGYPDTPDTQVKNERVQKYLGASGYSVIMWGADTRDWEFKENIDAEIAELNKDLKKQGASPQTSSFIILMHDVHPTTANLVLPKVVDYVTGLGYKIVPLTECIGVQSAYQVEGNSGLVSNLNASTTNSTIGAAASSTQSSQTGELTRSSASAVEVKMVYSVLAIILSFFFLFYLFKYFFFSIINNYLLIIYIYYIYFYYNYIIFFFNFYILL
jgi:peptidoglycan/xylan/chitin deacetylase (PgdA/CDA1 family)